MPAAATKCLTLRMRRRSRPHRRRSVVALGSHEATLDTAWAPVERHAVGAYLSFETRLDSRRLKLASRLQPWSGCYP